MHPKNLLLIVCCLLFAQYSWGQAPDTIQLLNRYLYSKPDSAIWIGQRILADSSQASTLRQAEIKNILGEAYTQIGQYEVALDLFLQCLQYYQTAQNFDQVAHTLNQLVIIHRRQNNPDEIIKIFDQVMQLGDKVKDLKIIGNTYNNRGIAHLLKKENEKALDYYQKALWIRTRARDSIGIGQSMNNIGLAFSRLDKFDSAMWYYQKSMIVNQNTNNFDMLAAVLDNIGDLLTKQQQYEEALQYYERSLTLAQQTKARLRIVESYESYVKLYEKKQDYPRAYYYQKRLRETADSLFNIDKHQQVARMEILYEVRKKNEEIKNLQELQAMQALQLKREQQLIWVGGLALVLAVGLFGIAFWAFLNSRHTNRILSAQKQNIEQQKGEILIQNEELLRTQETLLEQQGLLAKQNEELTHFRYQTTKSMQAAHLIQKAILPHKSKMKEIFGEDYFIVNRAKDIVSGDFWWIHEQDNRIILALADCTGHGVSGALMTMIGATLLDKIVKAWEIISPAQILNHMDHEIGKALQQQETGNRDGMDLVIVVIEYNQTDTINLTFEGAKRSLYYTHEGKIEVIKGTRKFLGGYNRNHAEFTDKIISLSKGEMLYLFSDGYVDQPNQVRKNFSEKAFQDLLISIQHLPVLDQKKQLVETLNQYMQGVEQRDDILVLGVKV